ncbi:MAG TPA: lipid A-modifier LpxR family protein [Polyangiaceae bacterium]|nr:lipid A-modifier LpxR family protein [Polyangiaceae bacterium]
MQKNWAYIAALALGALVSPSAAAQELGVRGGVSPIHEKGRFSIVAENDAFTFYLPGMTDRFYTNGVYLASEWSSPLVDDWTRNVTFGELVPSEHRAYFGFGFTHELHTPETINPCGAKYNDPLATSEEPRDVGYDNCKAAENDWREHYADEDQPFSALWSLFISAQRYFDAGRTHGAFSELRIWARVDLGQYGEDAARGYEVQKYWHGFFNQAVLGSKDEPAATPMGWKLGEPGTDASWLVQGSIGSDLNLYRETLGSIAWPLGFELVGRGHSRVGSARNDLGADVVVRLGLLPEHASLPLKEPGQYQASNLYIEGSAGGVAVLTDATQGAFDDYRHFLDGYSLGLHAKAMGAGLSLSLNWERIAFLHPLKPYPSHETIDETYHRYGRAALEFSY